MLKNNYADKELKKLAGLIYKSKPTIRPDYVVGFYRYWAKIDAIEQVLLKNKIISKSQIDKEMVLILKRMEKDFIFK